MTYNQPVTSRIWLGSLDDTGLGVNAQYNPKELPVDQAIPWSKHDKGNADGLQWEFTGAQGRTTSVDLLFDAAEDGDGGDTVIAAITTLQTMAAVRDPTSTEAKMRRPHHCVAVWGKVLVDTQQPRFQCVITQLTVKYTMFSKTGNPLRATVTVKLQEATRVSMAQDDDGGSGNAGDTDGNDQNDTPGDNYGDS
jgi:hypothetical protein